VKNNKALMPADWRMQLRVLCYSNQTSDKHETRDST